MIVVSDSSPLITLARARHLDLLRDLFEQVIIPHEVQAEVTVAGAGLPGAAEVQSADWIQVRPNVSEPAKALVTACVGLGAGEQNAILLASTISADLLC